MNIFLIILALICAYLIGSFPSPYVIGRLFKGVDIRRIGSHNMGAMNVFYKVGFGAGLLVLAIDIGKGAAAVALARFLGTPDVVQLLAGIAAVLGHAFTIFLKFRGGKGGATCIGILVYVMPWGIPIYLVIFGISMLISRYPTLSYSLAFVCYPFIAWLIYHRWEYIVFSIVVLLLPAIRYIPRVKEMHDKAGSWHNVVLRKGFKDRL